MKTDLVENVVFDESQQRTYVVMADRTLTDGELYRAIRLELLRRGTPLARGERLVINTSQQPKSKGLAEAPVQLPAE